jgi:hypothetical protein
LALTADPDHAEFAVVLALDDAVDVLPSSIVVGSAIVPDSIGVRSSAIA